VDSAALGELGASLKRAREKKGELKLLSPSRKVVEILRLVRFDALFDIHDDEREAIASFSRSD
jgi:anti-sigma B factor antagonist